MQVIARQTVKETLATIYGLPSAPARIQNANCIPFCKPRSAVLGAKELPEICAALALVRNRYQSLKIIRNSAPSHFGPNATAAPSAAAFHAVPLHSTTSQIVRPVNAKLRNSRAPQVGCFVRVVR